MSGRTCLKASDELTLVHREISRPSRRIIIETRSSTGKPEISACFALVSTAASGAEVFEAERVAEWCGDSPGFFRDFVVENIAQERLVRAQASRRRGPEGRNNEMVVVQLTS